MLTAPAVFAGTTGQLSGRILDENGDSLVGASVSAASPSQIGGSRPAVTDTQGRFQYPRLAPGYYTVRIELDGYLPQQVTEVQVRLDRTTELLVTLPSGSFGDEVDVLESTPAIDPEQVSIGQTFTSDYIQEAAIGLQSRYYLGMLSQTAGVEQAFTYGLQVLGSTSFDNAFLVDGMDTTDPFDMLPSFGSLSFEAVDEVAIHTAGFEAQYGRATGGVVNLVTKSGGNRFSGSVDYRYSPNDFQTRGDHFDPDEQPVEASDLNASLGGPISRDRAWFFLALQSFSEDFTPSGAPTTREWREQNYLGKLTWQAGSNWLLVGKAMSNPIEWANNNTSQFRAPEANAQEAWEVDNLGLDLSGVFSSSLLFGLRIGGQESTYEFLPQSGDLTTIGHLNLDTREFYGNFANQNYDRRERREVDTDLTWFVDGLAGSHDVKTGLKYTDSGFTSNFCSNGSGLVCTAGAEGLFFRDVDGEDGDPIPFQLVAQTATGPLDFGGSIWSTYVQDSWRIRPDLTVKLGMRWDGSQQNNDTGEGIADLSLLQPRLGLAWNIGGTGRNVLRASWGQFMHPSSLHIADFTAAGSTPIELWLSCSAFITSDAGACAGIAAAAGLGYRQDQEGWDPAGWFLDPGLVFFSDPSRTSPDLEPMHADELVLAFERELLHRTSVELSYVKKDTKKVIEDTCNGNVPTPTPDSDCSHYVVANLPGLRKDYEGLLLRFESRALDRMHLIGSYVYSESKGAVPGWDITANFDFYPYHFVNQYGYLDDHSRHRVKLNGYVHLPWDLSLAFDARWASEFRWAPRDANVPGMPYGWMLVEPRGSRSEDGTYRLDLQLGKGFDLGPARLRLFGTVYNVLDSENPIEVCVNVTGCGDFELGDATEWQWPRRYELGARIEF